MTHEPHYFFTPLVGRMTHGDVSTRRTKDKDNRPIPEDKQQFEIGVAFPKADLWAWLTGEVYPYLTTALATDQAALQRMQGWFSSLQGFSMKITDGDRPNAKGQVNENTAGQFVVWFSSSLPPKVVTGPASDNLQEINPSELKRGYYVQVAGSIKPNGLQGDNAGIYVNFHTVWLRAKGEVISGGVDPTAAFGAAGALPAGAQPYDASGGASGAFGGAPQAPQAPAVPTAPAPGGMVPAGMPGQAPALPGAPQQTASPSSPQPHPGILAGPPPLPGT